MASIRDVNLIVSPGRTTTRRTVTVTYEIRFSIPEVLSACVFRERVALRSDDPTADEQTRPLLDWWMRAESSPVSRRIVRQIAVSALDEDADTVILDPSLALEDEMYARVQLTPFAPERSEADSTTVRAQIQPEAI